MDAIQTEMKEWIANLCGNDYESEQKIRGLILQSKDVVREINKAYNDRNVIRIQKLIKDYLLEKNIIVRTCKKCSKKNVVNSSKLKETKCEHCNKLLLESKSVEIVKVENNESGQENRRKCIYCDNPVSPIPNSFTCNSCRNVTFNLYG